MRVDRSIIVDYFYCILCLILLYSHICICITYVILFRSLILWYTLCMFSLHFCLVLISSMTLHRLRVSIHHRRSSVSPVHPHLIFSPLSHTHLCCIRCACFYLWSLASPPHRHSTRLLLRSLLFLVHRLSLSSQSLFRTHTLLLLFLHTLPSPWLLLSRVLRCVWSCGAIRS